MLSFLSNPRKGSAAAISAMPDGSRWTLLTRHPDILAQQAALSKLALTCGQPGVMDSLDYTLSVPFYSSRPAPAILQSLPLPAHLLSPRAKLPRLLLRHHATELTAAVLVYEYHAFGLPFRVYIPGDVDGFRTLLAPAAERSAIAAEAARFLLEGAGARVVLLSYPDTANAAEQPAQSSPRLVASQHRTVARTLPLAETLDATLAVMGPRTRRNLRAAQRRVIREHGATYVPHAQLSYQEFLRFDAQCAYPMPRWVADWRYHAPRALPEGIFAGLRAADGSWLSLIGGRRQHGTACVDWQMNASHTGSLSLVTAMRAFFLAAQVADGVRAIRFEYGTSHSIQHAFLTQRVQDLLFTTSGLTPVRLRRLAPLLPGSGTLADTLASDSLVWNA